MQVSFHHGCLNESLSGLLLVKPNASYVISGTDCLKMCQIAFGFTKRNDSTSNWTCALAKSLMFAFSATKINCQAGVVRKCGLDACQFSFGST